MIAPVDVLLGCAVLLIAFAAVRPWLCRGWFRLHTWQRVHVSNGYGRECVVCRRRAVR